MMTEETTWLEEQQLSEEDKELVDRIYSRLDIFQQKNAPFHTAAKNARETVHMRDPEQDDVKTFYKNGKKTLQLQTLKSTINNVVADQMASMPEAKLLPETPEMQEMADDLQDAVHYIIYCANNYEQLHYRRVEDFYVAGTAVTQIAWDPDMDYGRGNVALIRYPIEAFLWDPTAERLEDCRAVMKVAWHPLSWYLEHYPEEGKYVACDSHTHNDVGLVTAQVEAEHANDEQRALMIEYWWREYDADKRKYTINVAYCAGGALLDKQLNVYAHGMYPFVLDVHDTVEGCLVGEGLVHELAPQMRYINRYASYIDMNLRMSSKGRIIMRKGSGIDRDAFANMDNDIIEGDRVVQGEDWNWIQNVPFNGQIANQMYQLESELKQDSGANQFTRGETTGGIVSGKAINSLIQAGGKVSVLRTSQLNYGFQQIVEQVLWLMAQFYDRNRMLMITGRDGSARQLRVDSAKFFGKKTKGAIQPPPYAVQIEVSTRDPQRIANQNQMFMEAYTMAAQAQQFFPLSSLFEILNLDGKDRIMPVIRNNEAYQQQMQAMQQQLEQMAAQMQGLQKENDNLRYTTTQMTSALSSMSAQTGKGFVPQGQPVKAAEPGGGPTTAAATVARARQQLGQETSV